MCVFYSVGVGKTTRKKETVFVSPKVQTLNFTGKDEFVADHTAKRFKGCIGFVSVILDVLKSFSRGP